MLQPSEYYQEKQTEFAALAAELRKRYDRLALLRLLLFVGLVAGLILLWSISPLYSFGALFVLLPFIILGVKKHLEIFAKSQDADFRAQLAAGELKALDHAFGSWPDGAAYLQEDHPYALDLDLFGPHSLYQFLNRTTTSLGASRLAEMLAGPANTAVIVDRQRAIEEMAAVPDWCHSFRARGMGTKEVAGQADRLLKWVEEPSLIQGKAGITILTLVAPFITVLTFYLVFTIPLWQLALIGLLPALLALRKYKNDIQRLHQQTAESGDTLERYRRLIEWAEDGNWESPLLQKLHRQLGENAEASRAIRRLRYAISQLDVRYNAFAILIEVGGLWSLHWLRALDRWRDKHRSDLPNWLATLAELDALVSWANLRYNQPAWQWPKIADDATQVTAKNLAHPLIKPQGRVANNFKCATDGHIHLVTGSNMAGKSTWLRTVGVNMVLALAGGPVCAASLEMPQLQVWTSMRTQDALSESTSSFFAELKRLKLIIEAVEGKERRSVFFLLDEILKGTNSRDRHTGARALIRQLIRAEGAGIIATHDLELAEMEKEAGSEVENHAMEVQIVDGQLDFDYKLRRGVSQSFNATVLMAQMGIQIDPKDIQLHHE
ncbi:MAG: hypothetical protein AAF433_22780 [Bacteroidota bacterium]